MKFPTLVKYASFSLIVSTTTLFTAFAAADSLKIELNKLEETENACRIYLLFENKTGISLQSLKLDLVLFDQSGVINKRLAIEGGPVNNGKTSVKLFEIADLKCSDVSRVLLNDIINCQDSSGPKDGCVDLVTTSSRNEVSFFK